MKIIKGLLSRFVLTAILIILQIFFFFYLIFAAGKWMTYVYVLFDLVALFVVLYLVNKSDEPTLKMSWLLLIVIAPIVGVPLYSLLGENHLSKRYLSIYSTRNKNEDLDKQNKEVINKLKELDNNIASQFEYVHNSCSIPVSDGTRSEFLKSGEIFFDKLLQELKKAKKYIFMEYYIIEEGKMWNSILTVLKKKVDEGVDVRVIYDDLGCIKTLPYGYDKKLRRLGIKCYKFNRFVPIVSATHNNRDHRKITIIDGKVGFLGGINLADEYINEKVKYGHWKDTGVLIEGKAVDSLVEIFIPVYNAVSRKKEDINLYKNSDHIQTNEYLQVYVSGPRPAYDECVGEDVYLNIINGSNKYLYITTPYLIVDYNITHALELAAKRGVDVKIIVPHIPDKKLVFMMTQQSYEPLLKAGVKIYEYTPGFIHSKTMTSDDKLASIGTMNLDYRSLVHNFECGTYIYNSETVIDMRKDYENVLNDCDEIDIKNCKVKWYVSLFRKLLSFFAPLF